MYMLVHLSEKAMAPHSSTLAWKIPWMEEPGRLQSMGSLRVGHDWVTSFSLFTFMHWRRKWQPTPVFLPGESQRWGSLVGCRLWVPQNQTRLKRLSSSSSSKRFTGTHTYRCPPDGSFSLDALGFPELMPSSEKSCLHNIYCCFLFSPSTFFLWLLETSCISLLSLP